MRSEITTLSEALRIAMDIAGSQKKLAKEINATPSLVSRWRRELVIPSHTSVAKIAKYLSKNNQKVDILKIIY